MRRGENWRVHGEGKRGPARREGGSKRGKALEGKEEED